MRTFHCFGSKGLRIHNLALIACMAATGALSMVGMEIPDDLARLAAEVDVDDAVIESTLSVDGEQFDASYRLPSVADAPGESPRHITQCPYEQYHRQGSQQLYRIPVGGIKCCNFCRRRVQEWVSAFTKVKNFHPMYDPAEFQQCTLAIMSALATHVYSLQGPAKQ